MNYSFSFRANKATTVKRLLAKAGVSHRLFKRLVDAQTVWVNNRQVQNEPLIHGQVVRFEIPPVDELEASSGALDVVLDLPNWLVVNKPVGLASVPGPSNPTDTLLNRAAGYLIEHEQIEGPQPAIMTRLDRDTCGLVLIAKHPYAQGRLDAEPADVFKQYRAVVVGHLDQPSGTVDLPLAKAADGVHREVRQDGQSAVTDYRVVATNDTESLVEFTLHTGRTHQIRVHAQALGHPLVGDALYGGDTATYAHQLLQASALTFTDPFSGEKHALTLPNPADWPQF